MGNTQATRFVELREIARHVVNNQVQGHRRAGAFGSL